MKHLLTIIPKKLKRKELTRYIKISEIIVEKFRKNLVSPENYLIVLRILQ